ncbi:MAG: class I SAM-dependent methyltransferase [Thermodesulfobacteriota bacterium]|nr:class I SAM-dependent methyltransferase [Thermodesulfobacteriota bacterium]
MSEQLKIRFPKIDTQNLDQDEEYFYLMESDDKEKKLLFHEYDEIYKIKGLYELLFYGRLKCNSPNKVAEALKYALSQDQGNFTELRVLDLGAGNGMMGEELRKQGCARLVGADIIDEAYGACQRDRPTVYDAYEVVDFCDLNEEQRGNLQGWSFDCLTTVAALGFGDIPAKAFIEAFNILQGKGWIAFNIKETFLDKSDTTGFSVAIRELIFSEYLDIYYLERYRHRLSMEGQPLYYFAIAGRKNADIPQDFLTSIGI